MSGLVGGVSVPSIFFRAFIVLLSFVFFAAVVNIIAVSFLDFGTDNFSSENETSGTEGGKVNIVLSDDDDVISENPAESGQPDEEVSSLLESEDVTGNSPGKGGNFSSSTSAASLDIDSLPDLGSFSATFSSAVDNEEKKTDSDVENGYNESDSFSSGRGRPADGLVDKITAQNNPEDLAKAVKTVLKREETS